MGSFYNEKLVEGLTTGIYICRKCGSEMEFEDEWRETLVCPKCGDSIALERYGFTDEEYEALYPTLEELEASEEE